MQLIEAPLIHTLVDDNLGELRAFLQTFVSSRISKGQGYQGFLRKRAGSSFGQKRAICVEQGKT
jgi:hypothetical protein